VNRLTLMPKVVALGALISCGAAPRQPDVAFVQNAIDSMLAEHARVLIREDLDAAMELYSENPVIRPNHAAPLRGRQSVREFIGGWFTGLTFKNVTYNNEEVAVFGDTALVIGTVEATVQPEGGDPIIDKGSYIVLFTKNPAGQWRSHRAVFNSSVPLPAPQ
jgi:ketosteroid isomerase-like protein